MHQRWGIWGERTSPRNLGTLALDLTKCQSALNCTVMPTYEYGCAACGHEWEEMQRITEAPIEVCPKCGKTQAHRLISAGTNFILKGGGWYSDLYSSSKGGAKKADGSSDASSHSTPGSEKSETKSEAKADGKSEAKAESKAESKPAPTTPSPSSSS
jgi:putative FmdB family regulatory protein